MAIFYEDPVLFVWSVTVLSTLGYFLGVALRPSATPDASESKRWEAAIHRYIQYPLLLFVVFHVLFTVYDRSEATSIMWAWITTTLVAVPQILLSMLSNTGPETIFTRLLYFVAVSGGIYVPLSGVFDQTATLLVLGAASVLVLAMARPWLRSTGTAAGRVIIGFINALESTHQSYFSVMGWWMIGHDHEKDPDRFTEPPNAGYWVLVIAAAVLRFVFTTWRRPGAVFTLLRSD